MVYRYLGADRYEIRMQYYVDCENGSPGAIAQDRYAIFNLFAGDERLDTFWVHRNAPKRLNATHYTCINPPPNACIDMYIYDTVLTLPPIEGGYIVSYQRCCRNHSILNLSNPGGTGSTYSCHIPGPETADRNNSAFYNFLPPNFLCVNQPLNFDHSATDNDGDSLAYRLCEPKLGADSSRPRPMFASKPPYEPIKWITPYDEINQLPTRTGIDLDSINGRLKLTPSRTGQYVFGICVDEYRNGELINTNLRDFQFNILNCEVLVSADFIAPPIACDTVFPFKNRSTNGKEYFWDFGIDNRTDDTSTSEEPYFTFPQFGTYEVSLRVINGNCRDSIQKTLQIVKNYSILDSIEHIKCKEDTLVLQAPDFNGYDYVWSHDSMDNLSGNEAKVINGGDYHVSITNGICFYKAYFNVIIDTSKPEIGFDTVRTCEGTYYSFYNAGKGDVLRWRFGRQHFLFKDSVESRLVPNNESRLLKLVTNYNGCIDSSVSKLKNVSNREYALRLPNVFTPNYDGINDCFKPELTSNKKDCDKYQMIIYNRWGTEIFREETEGRLPCWNGSNQGNDQALPAGTYFYLFYIEEKAFHGTILLIR